MKTKALLYAGAAVLLCAVFSAQLFAAPCSMVTWQRGEEGTTWQEWYFEYDNSTIPDNSTDNATDNTTSPVDLPAEQGNNPYGPALLTIGLTGDSEGIPPGWLANYGGRIGVWHSLFTELLISIPNSQERNPSKEVWVEVGFNGQLMPHPDYPDYPGDIFGPTCTAYIGGSEVSPDNVTEICRIITYEGPWFWKKLIIGWRIEPNPDAEDIYLAFHNSGADIDYVIADTKCFPPPNGGGEGCTPGYWKQRQHFDSWPSAYMPTMLFKDVFGEDAFPGKTLLQVLWQGGGGLRALGRHAVAALLNAGSMGVDYDLMPAEVINMFQDVYPGSRYAYTELKNIFEGYNEQGCPLN